MDVNCRIGKCVHALNEALEDEDNIVREELCGL